MKNFFFGLIATVLLLTADAVNAQTKSKATCRTFSVGVNIAIFSIATDVTICCTGGWCGCGTHPNCTMNRTSEPSACTNTSTVNEINVDVVLNDSKIVDYLNSQNQTLDDFVNKYKLNITNSTPLEVDGVLYTLELGSFTIEKKGEHYVIYAKIIKR